MLIIMLICVFIVAMWITGAVDTALYRVESVDGWRAVLVSACVTFLAFYFT